jgi:hypothetical protein
VSLTLTCGSTCIVSDVSAPTANLQLTNANLAAGRIIVKSAVLTGPASLRATYDR